MQPCPVQSQKGFTLIELVMVIVILGVLAAVAVPKFISVREEARTAAMQSALAAVRTAAEVAKAKCIVTPGCHVPGQVSVSMNGATMDFYNGYPNAGQQTPGQIQDWVTVSGFTVTGVPMADQLTRWQLTSARDPATCYVQYQRFLNWDDDPTGRIGMQTAGC